MNANGTEQRVRATQRFIAWLQDFHPEMAAAVIERGGEAPKTGALNQLGDAWDMFYPSNFYSGTGYRGRWHSDAEHNLGQIDPFGGVGTPTPTADTSGEAWYVGILDFAKQAVPAYLAYDAQKDIMDLNMERARQGLDPVDPGIAAPQVRVVHDFPPAVQDTIRDFKMGGMQILLWGGLAIGAFFLVRQLR